MKNTPQIHNLSKRHQAETRDSRNDARQPETNCHFQSTDFTGSCGKPAKFEHPAFSDLSKAYFAEEAPRGFAVEAGFFAALIALAILPIVDSAHAVGTLVHHIGLL